TWSPRRRSTPATSTSCGRASTGRATPGTRCGPSGTRRGGRGCGRRSRRPPRGTATPGRRSRSPRPPGSDRRAAAGRGSGVDRDDLDDEPEVLARQRVALDLFGPVSVLGRHIDQDCRADLLSDDADLEPGHDAVGGELRRLALGAEVLLNDLARLFPRPELVLD